MTREDNKITLVKIRFSMNTCKNLSNKLMNLREVESLKSLHKKLDKTKQILRSYSIVKVYYFVNIVIFLCTKNE